MGKSKQQRRDMISGIFFCAMLLGIGVGHDIGHAQIQQGEVLIYPSSVAAPALSGNTDKHMPMSTNSQEGNGCIKPQGLAQFDQPLSQAQAENHASWIFKVTSVEKVDERLSDSFVGKRASLQAVINAQWSGMMTALTKGDIEQALTFIATSQREVVRQDWTTFRSSFGGLAQAFAGPLHVTDMHGTQVIAKATMPPIRTSFQCPLKVNFIFDTDEQWRVHY